MIGEFRISGKDNGPTIITFGPRNLSETEKMPRQCAFVVWPEKMVLDREKLAAFLNAAVKASHGDLGPLTALVPITDER